MLLLDFWPRVGLRRLALALLLEENARLGRALIASRPGVTRREPSCVFEDETKLLKRPGVMR